MCDPLCTSCCNKTSESINPCPPPCTEIKERRIPELRASILYTTCDCVKRNGLQDQCGLRDCQGTAECIVKPDAICPAAFQTRKFLNIQAEFAVRASSKRDSGALCGGGGNADLDCDTAAGYDIVCCVPCCKDSCPGKPQKNPNKRAARNCGDGPPRDEQIPLYPPERRSNQEDNCPGLCAVICNQI